MLTFLQTEIAGLRLRWPRVLILLTCLAMVVVVAEQQRAIEAQSSLIAALSNDSNQAKLKGKQPKVSVYITDSHIIEPAAKAKDKTPAAEDSKANANPARLQKFI